MRGVFCFLGFLYGVLVCVGEEAFVDNGVVRVGVDLSAGGSVFYFGESGEGGRNVLNYYDRGRFVQQSYYGNRDGSVWGEKPWRWNPVQGGHYEGAGAKVLTMERGDGGLHVVSVPKNWAGGEDLEDCRMEAWIRVDGDVGWLRYRFTYSGTETHVEHAQEMPAVFVDAALKTMVYEVGGELKRVVPGWPNESHKSDGEWVAYVGEDGEGIGILTPGTTQLTAYRFAGDPKVEGSACSYVAALRTFAITPGLVVEYDVYLTTGSVEEIRERFAAIKAREGSRE